MTRLQRFPVFPGKGAHQSVSGADSRRRARVNKLRWIGQGDRHGKRGKIDSIEKCTGTLDMLDEQALTPWGLVSCADSHFPLTRFPRLLGEEAQPEKQPEKLPKLCASLPPSSTSPHHTSHRSCRTTAAASAWCFRDKMDRGLRSTKRLF